MSSSIIVKTLIYRLSFKFHRVPMFCALELPSMHFFHRNNCTKSGETPKKSLDEPIIDFTDIERSMKGKGKEKPKSAFDEEYMNFKRSREREEHERSFIFGWPAAVCFLSLVSCGSAFLLYNRRIRLAEEEKHRKIMIGKARIGGEWELMDTNNILGGSEALKGKWLLIYFGFTHCPDICPDELEKMVKAVDILDEDKSFNHEIIPVFISIDPRRDTIERVKAYCAEFSPKLRGFTGNGEQVEKVAKTFRVYFSQGPSATSSPDDYIVDHTVIKYLIDPEGNFQDYFGLSVNEYNIAETIKLKAFNQEFSAKSSWF